MASMGEGGAQPDDSDRPAGLGGVGALRLRIGRLAIAAGHMLKPQATIGVRLLAIDDGGRVLLVRHSYLPGLYLPGGGVEPGETCREAALREGREEGNVEVAAPPELFHVYWNRALRRRDHVVLFVARGARQRPEPPPRSLEIVEAAFFDPADLPGDTTPATRARLAEAIGGKPPAEIW